MNGKGWVAVSGAAGGTRFVAWSVLGTLNHGNKTAFARLRKSVFQELLKPSPCDRLAAQYKHKTTGSGEDVLNNLAMDIRQTELATLEFVSQPFVIDSQQVHQCGLKVVDMHRVIGHVDPQIIRRTMADARLCSATRHPDGVGIGMVIASPPRAIVDVTLQERGASKFSAPNHKRVFQ